ncbi:MAG: hypothetical protein P9X22_06835 [Candidatus Zapsychrus exili]|nr:hypothetical protein [Candidatus Zapsychrus exili]
MELKTRKLCLEVYGVLRMILGVGQIVGLFSGFFLTEWILKYPKSSVLYVFKEEIVVLVCLAILLRGISHIVTGIGIARLKKWGRVWLLWGWPIMWIVTFGIINSILHYWLEKGYVSSTSGILSWPKVFCYLSVIAFDFVFINSSIKIINRDPSFTEDIGGRIEVKKVSVLVFSVVLFFVFLLFLGRPIQRGFHQGYYKIRPFAEKTMKNKPANKAAPKKRKRANLKITKTNKEESFAGVTAEQPFAKTRSMAIIVNTKESAEVLDKDIVIDEESSLKKTITSRTKGDVPYGTTVAFLAGFSIIIGFLFQILEVNKKPSLSSYVFICAGFLLWTAYGLSIKFLPLYLTSGIVFILCIVLAVVKLGSEE